MTPLPPIILSVAFGERYIEQQARLAASIARTNPDVHTKHWTNEYPTGSSEHLDSLYGFKVHAIQWALTQGYKQIIWMDTAIVLNKSIDRWDAMADKIGVLAAKDDNKLEWMIGAFALRYYGNPDISERHLVGGSLYYFSFNNPVTISIFNQWKRDESVGLFGNQDGQSAGLQNRHRNDESQLSMAMYDNGVQPISCEEFGYNSGVNPEASKFHFK